MTNLVDKVKSDWPSKYFVNSCNKNGCSVSLSGTPTHRCLMDMDTGIVDVNETKCDYIFVGGTDNVWVVPIELKRGAFRVSQVVKQLQAGAQFAEMISKGFQVRFQPIIASGAVNRKQPRQELRNKTNMIRFRGQNVNFERIRCRDSLASVLK